MTWERTYAAVIFDNDQTLIDSTQAIVDAWTQWAIEYGVTEEQLTGWHGHSTESVVRHVLPAEQAETALLRIEQLEVETAASARPLPGAAEAVAALRESGRCAIATSGTTAVAAGRLRGAGIEPPAVVVTASDVTHAKPAPDLFLLAAERLGVDPGECLVVEDAPAGVAAARAAGTGVLAVTTTTAAADLPADLIVADLAEVRFTPTPDGVRVERV